MKNCKPKETKTSSELPLLMDMHEAANKLGICYRTIQDMVYKRRIGFVKIGRIYKFRSEDLSDFIDKNYIKPVK